MSLLLGATLVGLALVSLRGFLSWRRRVLTQVRLGGEIAETAKGPVEFAITGTWYLGDAQNNPDLHFTSIPAPAGIKAPLTVGGTGGTTLLGSQYICRDLTLDGSGTIQITWNAKAVARKSGIFLVE